MKRLFCAFLAAFLAVSAWSQVSVDLSLIGRLEANPRLSGGDYEESGLGIGNSCLYTALEASFGEAWSLTCINHWVANDGSVGQYFSNTPDLYKNSFKTVGNWVDFLFVDYSVSSWTFRLGKDAMCLGGYEFDPYDWDCNYDTRSLYWNSCSCYQWGASAFWTTPSEMTTFQIQALSAPNPYGGWGEEEYWTPWYKGHGTYSFKHYGEYGDFTTSNSIHYTDAGKNLSTSAGMVGLSWAPSEKFALYGEYMIRLGKDDFADLVNNNKLFASHKAVFSAQWAALSNFDLEFTAGYDLLGIRQEYVGWDWSEDKFERIFAGATAKYYPMKNSRDLMIHATVATSTVLKGVSFTVGLLYNHVFNLK